MSGKKLMIVVVALGLVSFAGAFVMTQMFQPEANLAMSPEELRRGQEEKTTVAGIEAMKMGDNAQLENLIKEVENEKVRLARRGRDLDAREQGIQIAAGKLQEAARELESMRLGLAAPLVKLKGAKKALEETRVKIKLEEVANLKNIAKTVEAMDTESGGKLIEGMWKSQQDDAAKCVYYMTERGRAKLLSSMSPALVAELFKEMKKIQQEVELTSG